MNLRVAVLAALVMAAVLLAAPSADAAAHRMLKKKKKSGGRGPSKAKAKFVPPGPTKMAMFTAASPCQATQAIFGWYSLQKSPASNVANRTPFHAARVVYADHATDGNKNGLGPWQDAFRKAELLQALAAAPTKKLGSPLKKLVRCVKATDAAGLSANPKAAGCDFTEVGRWALGQCIENLKGEFGDIDMGHPLSVHRDGHWAIGAAGNRGDKSHCALACIAAVASSSRDYKSCSVALTQLASKGDRVASMALSSGANVVFPKPAWVPAQVQWHNAAVPGHAAYKTSGTKNMRFWRDLYRRHADPDGNLPASDDEDDEDVHAIFPPMGQRGSCSEDKIVAAEVAAIPSQTE